MAELTSFETIIFLHSLSMTRSLVSRRNRRAREVYTNGTLFCLSAELIGKDWQLQFEKAEFHRLSDPIAPCMWYNESLARFTVLSKRSGGCSCQLQNTAVHNVGSPLTQSEGLDTEGL